MKEVLGFGLGLGLDLSLGLDLGLGLGLGLGFGLGLSLDLGLGLGLGLGLALGLGLGLEVGLGVSFLHYYSLQSKLLFKLKDLYLQLKTLPILWFYKQFLISFFQFNLIIFSFCDLKIQIKNIILVLTT